MKLYRDNEIVFDAPRCRVDAKVTAPKEPGVYTLWEIADCDNCHIRFEWRKVK